MTGKEILMQALREKCLHKLMSTQYQDEGDLYWTFFGMLGLCFAQDHEKAIDPAMSFEECYNWDTYFFKDVDAKDAEYIQDCVDESFEVKGDQETDNIILRLDHKWAKSNQIMLHPSVQINNMTYTNSTGEGLAMSICAAYREAPDECELSWETAKMFDGEYKYDGLEGPAHAKDEGLFSQASGSLEPNEGEILLGSWHLVVVIVLILAINLAVMFFVHRRMKR